MYIVCDMGNNLWYERELSVCGSFQKASSVHEKYQAYV